MPKIRIPKHFLLDHQDRDLPTPDYAPWRGGFVVDTEHEHFDELLSDAQYYADPWGPDACQPELKRSAKALLKAVAKETAFIYHIGK